LANTTTVYDSAILCLLHYDNILTTLQCYNEGGGTRGRVHLLYTGQHYDPLVMEKGEGEDCCLQPVGEPTSLFLEGAVAIAQGVKEAQARRLKEIRKKMIKCSGCGALCDGPPAFQAHWSPLAPSFQVR
jgi:hypothetical protein